MLAQACTCNQTHVQMKHSLAHLQDLIPTLAGVLAYQDSSRLTVVSREAKKKQHARASSGLRDHYSELFTRMAALKF